MYYEQNKKIHELSDAFSIESSRGSVLRNVFFFFLHSSWNTYPQTTTNFHKAWYRRWKKKKILRFYCLGNMLKRDISRKN